MKEINDMTLDELNAEIKALGKALNQRIDRVKASTRLTSQQKATTLDYLSAQATSAAPKGTKKQLNRFSRAAVRDKGPKAVAAARQRVKKMREAVRSKTRAADVNRSASKRRQTFGEKLFPDKPRQLSKKEMDTLGKALGTLKKGGIDSEQIINVYKSAFRGDKKNMFRDGDSLIAFMRQYAGGIPEQEIEAIKAMAAPDTFIEIDETETISFKILNNGGELIDVYI